ncbi:YHS domain-containing protein [Pedobacter changchengzhani]|uniref:YHS domain-containing protein n=2 Tax=Pedobacter changchengzhani TaxID=2529274 RepID=A0A4R5MJK9_9SPHI|nr:YHS domain-containing protein [Pedobacter changchengzhani]
MLAFNVNAKQSVNITKETVQDSVQSTLVDPVCKMKVKANSEKSTVYKKVTYHFCSESCKNKFVAAPTKYIKK